MCFLCRRWIAQISRILPRSHIEQITCSCNGPTVGRLTSVQIALQLAITFARIARLDYPGQWPTLVADVMSRVAAGPLAARRAYLVLHHVLKELASKRLPADQRNFAKVLTCSSSP